MRRLTERVAALGALAAVLNFPAAYAQESAAVESDGAVLYGQLCASCHGAQGGGDGVVSNNVSLRPRDFSLNAFKFDTDADWQRGTDTDLANVIKNGPAVYGGSSLMPPWTNLSDDDVSALVAHIRVLQQKGSG